MPVKDIFTIAIAPALEILDYKLYPSAFSLAKRYCKKSEKNNLFSTERDYAVCISAFIVAGKAAARSSGSGVIRARDIEEGWEVYLRICPGNLPPHRCAQRSIIEREEDLKNSLEGFAEVVEAIDKNLSMNNKFIL